VTTPEFAEADPFDLPDWLGVAAVTWEAEEPLQGRHRVSGRLSGDNGDHLPCDLLAMDDAYPEPAASERARVLAHQAWQHGEVMLADDGGRLVLLVPGSRLGAEEVLEAVARLARAVGAGSGRYAVRLRVGADQRRSTDRAG
jgi:hypothetical protein